MRVLLISPFPPGRDGIGDYSARLAEGLRSEGHVVAAVRPGSGALPEHGVIGGLPLNPSAIGPLAKAIQAWRPDVVHVQYAVSSFTTRVMSLLRLLTRLQASGIDVVVTAHEVSRDLDSLGPAGAALYRRLAALSTRVITHTQRGAEAFAALGVPTEKVEVLRHPRTAPPAATVTPEQLRLRGGLQDRTVLLAFGFIHVDKGLDVLVRALQEVVPAAGGRPPSLVVAGSVQKRRGVFRVFEARDRVHLRRVQRFVARHGLRDRVVFAGYVPPGEVASWFRVADVVVMPYRRVEDSGVASIAVETARPVVASRLGGLAESFAGSPWLCEPGDARSLANAISACLAAGPAAARRTEVAPSLASVVLSTVDVYARAAA